MRFFKYGTLSILFHKKFGELIFDGGSRRSPYGDVTIFLNSIAGIPVNSEIQFERVNM